HAYERGRLVRVSGGAVPVRRGVVLGRGGSGPSAGVLRAVPHGAGPVWWHALGEVVRRGEGEPGPQLRGPMGGTNPGQRGDSLGGRAGHTAFGHLCRTP